MRKTYTYITVLSVIFIGIIIYLVYSKKPDEISAEEACKNARAGNYDYIVDVRTKKEWDEGHLENTISIPIGNLVNELPEKIKNKNVRILFVCKKGIRASGVVTIAYKLGYTNVQAMIGNYSTLKNCLQNQTI
jgi:rhodanese-related sulfurtransferase